MGCVVTPRAGIYLRYGGGGGGGGGSGDGCSGGGGRWKWVWRCVSVI